MANKIKGIIKLIYFKKLLNKNVLLYSLVFFSFSFCGIDRAIKNHPMKTYPNSDNTSKNVDKNNGVDESSSVDRPWEVVKY